MKKLSEKQVRNKVYILMQILLKLDEKINKLSRFNDIKCIIAVVKET